MYFSWIHWCEQFRWMSTAYEHLLIKYSMIEIKVLNQSMIGWWKEILFRWRFKIEFHKKKRLKKTWEKAFFVIEPDPLNFMHIPLVCVRKEKAFTMRFLFWFSLNFRSFYSALIFSDSCLTMYYVQFIFHSLCYLINSRE